MKITTKKIIAREFLYAISLGLIGLLCFILIYPYNSYLENNIKHLNTLIVKKELDVDSMLRVYDSKIHNQEWYFKVMSDEFDVEEFNTWQKWWVHTSEFVKRDSFNTIMEVLCTKDDFFPSIGFSNGDSLKQFVIANTLSNEDIESLTQSANLKAEIEGLRVEKNELKSEVFSRSRQIIFAARAIFISALFLFGIRYLVYGIRWSLQTLRQK